MVAWLVASGRMLEELLFGSILLTLNDLEKSVSQTYIHPEMCQILKTIGKQQKVEKHVSP
jgi:hypothetical protein